MRNSNSLTRVHVIASRYQPRFEAFDEFARVRGIQPWIQSTTQQRSAYMAGRTLGDEYQYILNRRYAQKYPGNMLERPSLLISPWAVRETDNQVETLAEGDDFGDAGVDQDLEFRRDKYDRLSQATTADFANLNFLRGSSVLLANLKPDDDGIVSIDRKDLKGLNHVRVVALDSGSTVQQAINFEPAKLKLRDLRLANGLDPSEHYSQSKQTEVLKAGDVLTIEDLNSGRFQYFDEIGDVYRLFLTLNSNTPLAEFEFLLTWSEKSDVEQQTLYSKYACHELNFWLYKKDRPFFDAVVKNHVGYKLEQGPVDRFLTDQELESYTVPWQFARLNVFERILLAQRLENRRGQLVRSIDDLYLLNPIKREFLDTLYDTSIRTDELLFSETLARKNAFQPNDLPNFAFERRKSGAVPTPESAAAEEGRTDPGLRGGIGGLGGFDGARDPGKVEPYSANLSLIVSADEEDGDDAVNKPDSSKGESESKRLRSLGRETRSGSGRESVIPYGGVPLDEFKEISLGEKLIELRDKSRVLYRRLPPTREWVEQQYYKLPMNEQNPNLVMANRFWLDYAKQGDGSFLSPHFAESHRSFAEMMFALAVIDLPEKAPEHQFEYVDNSLKFTAGGSLIALHQQFRPTRFERQNTTVLIAENFFQKNDRYRQEDGVQYDKFVASPFHAHTLYGAQVVMTNPTSTPQAIDLLVQVPKGSVATSGSQETRSLQVQLNAYSTQTIEYFFYFPTAGEFPHYPAHVSRDEQVLAVAENIAFSVIEQPTVVDKSSWEYVSQNGSEDDVIEFLELNNVLQFDLAKIAFRMKEKSFFQRAIETLRGRYTYNHTLWSYGMRHQDEAASLEFLRHEDQIAGRVGRWFQSPLLDVVPYERNWYQHREYAPLVNARIHQLGTQRRILNPELHAQYHLLLDVLSNRSQLNSEDQLAVTYYLLLQDRIDEAIQRFGKVDRNELTEQIQFDYCDAYLDLFLEAPDAAAGKAEKYVSYPVDLWRNRFKNILAQVEEVRGGNPSVVDDRDNSQKQTQLAAGSSSFDFEIEAGKVKLACQNISEVQVNFYEMDIELMFSRSPFAEQNLDGFSIIRPNLGQLIAITADNKGAGSAEFEFPAELANKNVLVEISAGDQVQVKPKFASSMTVQTIEKFGQLKVAGADSSPLAKVYVKVYSQTDAGQIRFHKDGYTDLRGRFDYVSQSNNSLDDVERYSVLVLSQEHGVVMRQVKPPAE